MYNIRIVYTDGKEELFGCKDYYYDDNQASGTITLELNDKQEVDIMLHQIRKVYIDKENK